MYICKNEAFFDEDNMLWHSHIGTNDAQMSLQYTAYGRTREEAIAKAIGLAHILNAIDNGLKKMAQQN